MSLYDDLLMAGLPVVSATDGAQATFSRTLSDAELEIYLNLLFPNRQIQLARKANAINGAILAEQFKTATAQQAVDYVVQQITNGTTEAQALAAFDNAATFAAVKPILRNMLIGMYRTVDVLKLMTRILIAVRDTLWSDLPER